MAGPKSTQTNPLDLPLHNNAKFHVYRIMMRIQDGETALHRAALCGYVEVVKMLVDYGAAVDIRNQA